MRKPPIISFVTYQRLGNTAVSLPSLLRTEDDFELYLVDNGSRDATWEFLNDTKDPRIKHRKQFDVQIGLAHALNYILSHRAEDQDWINFEYDFRIHDKNFIRSFHEYYEAFPEIGAFSATAYPKQLEDINMLIERHPNRYQERNGKKVYLDTVMGFCTYIPYEIMNQIGYYDEVRCLLDMELQTRFEVMKKPTAYAMDIEVTHITHGGNCDTCLAYHGYCAGDRFCIKYYNRIISKVTGKIGVQDLVGITRQREAGEVPIYCNSIFSGEPMSDEDREKSQYVIDLFKRFTREFEERTDSKDGV